ncbi:phytanoyl-CoA dioxygenase family protein [Streptomyces sp. NPDC056323]|uniref:phytanoyl-CoA dioxygenase family protein n=1 Tax=Streptomyces sp. NPDC056323 TaxID=3345784 RepID=UPI0035E1887A
MHEGNGPLVVVPGPHRMGLFDLPEKEEGNSGWQQHVSADLAYTVSEERAEKMAAESGRVLITGEAGAMHAFHPSIVHSSSNNISPDRRALLLITYNAVDNAPENPLRPEFLVTRDSTRLTPALDDRLCLVDVETRPLA